MKDKQSLKLMSFWQLKKTQFKIWCHLQLMGNRKRSNFVKSIIKFILKRI